MFTHANNATSRSPDTYFSPQLIVCHRRAVQRQDHVLKFALQYGIPQSDLMRLNNLISEHSLYSRDYLYIPASEEDRKGACVTFEYSERARREYCRIVPEDEREREEQRVVEEEGKRREKEVRVDPSNTVQFLTQRRVCV